MRRLLAVVSAVVLLAGLAVLVFRSDRTDVGTTRSATPTTAPVVAGDEPTDPAASASPTSTAPEPATGSDGAAAAPATEPADPAATTPAGDASADPAATLRDRTFESVSVTEEGSGGRTFVEGGTLTVVFEGADDGDVVRWRISCNTAGGREG